MNLPQPSLRPYQDDRLLEYWSLSVEEAAALRTAIVSDNDWFFHATGFRTLRDIVLDRSLNPTWPQGDSYPPSFRKILCLTPNRSAQMPGTTKYPPVYIAIWKDDLPPDIGLDYSYEVGMLIARLDDGKTKTERMVDHIMDLGCIVAFEPPPFEKLRVRAWESVEGDPNTWPLLSLTHPRDWWWNKKLMPPIDEPEFEFIE